MKAYANDLHGIIPDDQIIKAAHAFWFQDKDWKGRNGTFTKICDYMCLNNGMK